MWLLDVVFCIVVDIVIGYIFEGNEACFVNAHQRR